MRSCLTWLRAEPCRFLWVLVILSSLVIPWLTRATAKPGEFYPFSNFPMYSRFLPRTYYVMVTDLNDAPVATVPLSGQVSSNIKKAYDRNLDELKKASAGKYKKADLPVEERQKAGAKVLSWLMELSDPAKLKAMGGLRLKQIDLFVEDGKIAQRTLEVGEVKLP
ncbi:MAG: hypothetical protein H7A55_23390 [Verrucomicrobiaceae bacterium]|nr:hypothetical protein [Verrucomicrobiaceae bacterium]